MKINHKFDSLLDEIDILYVESKKAIILLENYNPENKTFIAPLNEMRNALDHIMKMISSRNKSQDEFYEQYRGARSHIRRAGYDAYELLCISISDYIFTILKDFSSEDIVKGFPNYYSDIKPKIHEIKRKTAELRARKEKRKQQETEVFDEKVVNEDENTYRYYFEAFEELNHYCKIIENHIPCMLECKEQRLKQEQKNTEFNKKSHRYTILNIIVAVLLFLAGLVIGKFVK